MRFRLTSIEATEVDDSLPSFSQATRRASRRIFTRRFSRDLIAVSEAHGTSLVHRGVIRARSQSHRCRAIGKFSRSRRDVIAGFPARPKTIIGRRVAGRVASVHFTSRFPYSPRPGTAALRLTGQCHGRR